MEKWAEIRTAFQVAELGTISAAASAMGLHRATVVRHIEALELEMGAKIFQRHSKGYEPTEIGRDLLNVARETNDQFNQLVARARTQSEELSGDFIVTSHEHVAGLLIPALKQLQMENPSLHIQYLASAEVLKLEYGTAHIALRSGPKPMGPDNVVSAFAGLKFGMFAHDAYIARHGFPTDQNSLHNHKFVCWDTKGMGMPFQDWFEGHVKKPNILFSSSDLSVTEKAVHSGMGLGLIAEIDAPNGNGLHRVWPSPENWTVPLWLVTHVDLHRGAKVQGFLDVLKRTVQNSTIR